MKIGIYIRVSSDEQIKGNSLETQTKKGIDFCKYSEYQYKLYSEGGYSGTLTVEQLPQLSQLLTDLQEGIINGVYVSNLDRLTRNENNWQPILKVLNDTNSDLYIDGAKLDVNDPDMMLMVGIRQKLATHEIERLKYRVKQGLKSGMLKGNVMGGRVKPYGYMKGKNKKLIINPNEIDTIKLIFKLALEGKGTKAIATILNDNKVPTKLQNEKLHIRFNGKTFPPSWSDSVVYGILTNPIYYGNRRFKGELFYFEDLEIIDKDMFDEVQKGFKTRSKFKQTSNKYFYLLNGLIYCRCGTTVSGRIKPTRGERLYRCNSKREHISVNCGTRSHNLDELNDLVLSELKQLPINAKKALDNYRKVGGFLFDEKDIDSAKKRIEKYENQIDEVFNMDIPKKIKEKKINELNGDIERDQSKIDRLEMNRDYYTNQSKFVDLLTKLVNPLSTKKITDEQKQIIVRALIDKVIIGVHKGVRVVEILYKVDKGTKVKIDSSLKLDVMNYTEFDHTFNLVRIGTTDEFTHFINFE